MKRMGQKIVVFLFFILFFSLFFMLEKEKFTTNKYSFIHIPKTSGSAFMQFVNDSYSDHITIENHHVMASPERSVKHFIKCKFFEFYKNTENVKRSTVLAEAMPKQMKCIKPPLINIFLKKPCSPVNFSQ
jgi:hypothetical protein